MLKVESNTRFRLDWGKDNKHGDTAAELLAAEIINDKYQCVSCTNPKNGRMAVFVENDMFVASQIRVRMSELFNYPGDPKNI